MALGGPFLLEGPASKSKEANLMPREMSKKSERGQTMVEFAIVLPVMLMVLFAMIQFGITFKNYLSLTDAVRAGARVAAVSRQAPDPVGAATTKVYAAAADLDTSKLNVSVVSTWEPGEKVAVTATYPYSINVLGVVVKSGNLTSVTQERVE